MLIFILCNINRKISKLSILIYKITKKKIKYFMIYIFILNLYSDLGKRNKLFRIEIFFSSAQPFPFFFSSQIYSSFTNGNLANNFSLFLLYFMLKYGY